MWQSLSLSQQQCGREAPQEMQITASPLLSCERWFKSQGASGLLWDFWKCKSQSIFAESSCEISRGSTVLNKEIPGVNMKHIKMVIQEGTERQAFLIKHVQDTPP